MYFEVVRYNSCSQSVVYLERDRQLFSSASSLLFLVEGFKLQLNTVLQNYTCSLYVVKYMFLCGENCSIVTKKGCS